MLSTGAKRTPSADPSARQPKRSKVESEDEGGSQQQAQSPPIDAPENEPRRHRGSNTEPRPQLHQGSSSVSENKPQPPACFRVSNVPQTWGEAELLQVLRGSDHSLDLAIGQYQLSLYPACSGPSQTALLNIQCPGYERDLESNQDKLIGREDSDLVMDSHFYGLTPLNNPEGEIVVE